MKKVLFIIALVLVPMLASAAVEVDGIYYNLDSEAKTAEVTKGPSGYWGDIVIPESIPYNNDVYNVTSIGNSAFSGCSILTSITIPNSVTSIGEWAFDSCSGLTFITIPNSVTSIGKYAFCWCSGLTSFTISGSVTSIGDYAFDNCIGLTSFTVDEASISYKSVDGVLLSKDGTTLIAYPIGRPETAYTIPDGVTAIINGAFAGCSGLTSVTIPDGLTAIGGWAFQDCSGLTSITLPNSLTSIGSCAFRSCSGLTSITIPKSLTSLELGAFQDCSGLTSIKVESGNTKYDSRDNCNAIIEMASSTLIVGCQNTTIPKTVRGIQHYAFQGCSGLTSIIIPNSVMSIGSCAFTGCSGLTSITIPSSVTSVDRDAFSGCSGLTSVSIGRGVKSIGDRAFNACSGLTSIKVESGNTKYDSRDNCNAIIETASNTLIVGCQNTTISDGVKSIGNMAFASCSGLTSIIIPSSVTSIGNNAFICCSGLLNVYCHAEKVPDTQGNVFFDSNINNATLHVPGVVIEAYKATSPWNEFKAIVPLNEETVDGDVNGDGGVDVNDLVSLVNMIAAGDVSAAGDLNGDGMVDVADVIVLVDIITGQ